MLTPEQVKECLEFVSVNLPGKQEEKQDLVKKAELWLAMFADMPFELVRAALIKWAAQNKDPWFPTPGMIREIAFDLIPEIHQIPQPETAWAEVMHQLKRAGRSKKPQFSHELIKQAVDAIGWIILCESEAIGVERAHFLRIYGAYKDREIQGQKDQQFKRLTAGFISLAAGGEVKLLK